ncbi:UbiA family prenyltransferase [Nocardioides sp. ChNu-153]|uniref:UbiA family prenyltransferase n=1 Tax=unclassified Nocardioides TaxID=2615069 RepID=UPI0024066F8F|nr:MULTISPECIES: UbiA family prenyltransferase [unclassified Nocardioides]MDF9716849.1 UbiA family prenyltransferase [Nocardioides sp. ChNu-99]MDN7120235.1 UbiA family prenyltransferase [Nocardioides sp. ChNu-153]
MAAPTTSSGTTTSAASPSSSPSPTSTSPSDAAPARARRRIPVPGAVRNALALVVAAHPRQLVLTAAAVALAAFVAGRPVEEVALVGLTVAIGQAVLGWHNDVVDAEADRDAGRAGKPVADGRLDAGTVWFAVAAAVLALVPLSVANGLVAAAAYVGSLVVALLGNLVLRGSVLSWLPWAVSFGLYPVFLSYGGFGGRHEGEPPHLVVVALAALLGVCVHFLRALPGLVQDNRDGRRHLPLRVALRTGASRLLLLSGVATGLVVVGLLVAGATVGLTA